jgi:hypothetical protein
MPLIESQSARPLSASAFRWLGQDEIKPFSLLMPFQRSQRTLERIALLAGRCQLLEQPVVLLEQCDDARRQHRPLAGAQCASSICSLSYFVNRRTAEGALEGHSSTHYSSVAGQFSAIAWPPIPFG